MLGPSTLFQIAVYGLVISVSRCTVCYRNEAIGERDGNVYYCDSEDKPECCTEDGQFSCCEEQADKSMREQLILWGSLGAVVLVIIVLFLYFWKDWSCCKNDTPLKQRCCPCCRRKGKTDDEKDLTPIPETAGSSQRPWSSSLEHYSLNSYRATPAPPPGRFSSPAPPPGRFNSPAPPPFRHKSGKQHQ